MLDRRHTPNQAETLDDVRRDVEALIDHVVPGRIQASGTTPVERPGVTSPQGQQQQQNKEKKRKDCGGENGAKKQQWKKPRGEG